METVHIDLGERSYPIVIAEGLLAQSSTWQALPKAAAALVVTNDVVAPLYLSTLKQALSGQYAQVHEVVLPDGEAHKDWQTLNLIFDALGRQRNFFRQAYISGDFNNLENHTQSFFKKLLVTAVDNQRGDSEDDDISFSIDLYAVSLAHFFKEWVQKGGTDTKENLIAHLRDSSPEILFGYLA